MQTTPTVAIIGTGFAGLGMAIRLKEAGYNDFIILEKAADVGGPGGTTPTRAAACDVPSHLYSFSLRTEARMVASVPPRSPRSWTTCARPPTSTACGPHIRFSTEVVPAAFDEVLARGRSSCPTALHLRRRCSRVGDWTAQPTRLSRASPAWRASRAKCSTRPAGTTT